MPPLSVRLLLPAVLLALLPGCSATKGERPKPQVTVESVAEWRTQASDPDIERISRLPAAWTEALAAARKGGFARKLAAEGPLLDPGAAQPRAVPAPGAYLCRLVRLGATARRAPAFSTAKPGFCHVTADGERLSFTREAGSGRPAGYLYEAEDGRRMIFLGTAAEGNAAPLGYGENPARDLVGVVERVGPFRWRLVLPSPGPSLLDVYDLVPAPVQPK